MGAQRRRQRLRHLECYGQKHVWNPECLNIYTLDFPGHTINEKIWGWGQDPMMVWGQEHAWGTCFAELQTGVAPTQFHTFNLPAHGTHSHVEVFKPLTNFKDRDALYVLKHKLYSPPAF